MELQILGAHNMESKDTRMASHIINGELVLDAGSLTRSLSFDEQKSIRAILLSHRHFDHVRDLLPLGMTLRDTGTTVDVYAIKDTIDFVTAKLLDGSLYPDFLSHPSREHPVFRLHAIDCHQEFNILNYTVTAVPVPHSVPAAGFQISSDDSNLFFTGDTGRGLAEAWETVAPQVLLTEVTFGNQHEGQALAVGHLTPRLLEAELQAFDKGHAYIPRVIVTHMNPPWEAAIRQELESVAANLGTEIVISQAGMNVDIGAIWTADAGHMRRRGMSSMAQAGIPLGTTTRLIRQNG